MILLRYTSVWFPAQASNAARKFITGGVIKLPPLLDFSAAVGAIPAFKFQNLFQSAHQDVHGANIAFVRGGENLRANFTKLVFQLPQTLLQQFLEALDGGAGADVFLGAPQLPATLARFGNQLEAIDAKGHRDEIQIFD